MQFYILTFFQTIFTLVTVSIFDAQIALMLEQWSNGHEPFYLQRLVSTSLFFFSNKKPFQKERVEPGWRLNKGVILRNPWSLLVIR